MDRQEARRVVVENLSKLPEHIEKRLEALYINQHFGDVVTEVFPEVLDTHSEYGKKLLEKYANLATFLEETKDSNDGMFAMTRFVARNLEHHTSNPAQGVEAIAVRSYVGLRAEHFEVARDDNDSALGIAIAHPAYTVSYGWDGPDTKAIQPYAIVDTRPLSQSWTQPYQELNSRSHFFHGSFNSVHSQAVQFDVENRLIGQQVSGCILDMQLERIRERTGVVSEKFSVYQEDQ